MSLIDITSGLIKWDDKSSSSSPGTSVVRIEMEYGEKCIYVYDIWDNKFFKSEDIIKFLISYAPECLEKLSKHRHFYFNSDPVSIEQHEISLIKSHIKLNNEKKKI